MSLIWSRRPRSYVVSPFPSCLILDAGVEEEEGEVRREESKMEVVDIDNEEDETSPSKRKRQITR